MRVWDKIHISYLRIHTSYAFHITWCCRGNHMSLSAIGQVRYLNTLTLLLGPTSIYGVAFFVFKSPLGIERQKKIKKVQFWPESLGAMLEYSYIECGLLATFDILNVCLIARHRGLDQKKWINMGIRFPPFVSSKPYCQAEFEQIKYGLFGINKH